MEDLTSWVEDSPLILKEFHPKVWQNYNTLNSNAFIKAVKYIYKIIEPQTYKEALAGCFAKDWQQTIKEEYDSHIEHSIFEVTTLF